MGWLNVLYNSYQGSLKWSRIKIISVCVARQLTPPSAQLSHAHSKNTTLMLLL